MTHALRHAIALAVAVALLGLAVTSSALSKEPGSAFVASDAGLVADAHEGGFDVRRSIAGPAILPSLDAARTVLVVMHPTQPYDGAGQGRIDAFLARGGRVLLADAFGAGNSLLAPHGILLERVRLAETAATTTFDVGGRSFDIPLQQPTALHVASGAAPTVLARSSAGSFLDRDGDGLIAAGDLPGPFPIAAELTVGDGRLVVVADSALLAVDDPAVAQWRLALIEDLLPEGGLVAVDESHGGVEDPTAVGAGLLANAAAFGPWRIGMAAAAALAVAAAAIPGSAVAWGPHEFRPMRFRRRGEQDVDEASAAPVGSFWLPRGTVAVASAIALAMLALLTGSRQAAWGAAFLGVAAAAALQPRLPRLKAERTVTPQETSEGAVVQVKVRAESALGHAADLELRDFLPHHMAVAEGESWVMAHARSAPVEVSYSVRPALRGKHLVGPLVVRRTDVLQLRVRQATIARAVAVNVAPAREDVRRLPFNTRVPTITLGPHLVNRAGDGSEFQALRPYNAGDSMRIVNWKASARSREMMVNQRVHESQAIVTVFLDARAVAGAGPAAQTALAQGCRAILSVVTGALRMRDRLRFVAYGHGVRELDSRGAAQMHDLTQLLSTVEAAGTTGLGEAVGSVLASLRPGLPVIVASGLEDDPSLVDAVRTLRSRGLLVTVLAAKVIVDATDPADGRGEPEGAAILGRRDQTLAALRGLGVTVHEAGPSVPLDLLFKLGAA